MANRSTLVIERDGEDPYDQERKEHSAQAIRIQDALDKVRKAKAYRITERVPRKGGGIQVMVEGMKSDKLADLLRGMGYRIREVQDVTPDSQYGEELVLEKARSSFGVQIIEMLSTTPPPEMW
ncbi:MAG: hypothetical protein WCT36_04385 [Candidatus Gracilibacteria bacterium]|jgi:hypothetical protein